MSGLEFGLWPALGAGFRLFFGRASYYGVIGLVCSGPSLVLGLLGIVGLPATVVGLLSTAALTAVTTYAVMMELRGEPSDLSQSFHYGLQRFLPALGSSVAVVIVAVLLMLPVALLGLATAGEAAIWGIVAFSLAVGAWAIVRYFVAASAAVVEDLSPRASLGRSAALIRGEGMTLFGVLLLQMLVLAVPVMALTALMPTDPDNASATAILDAIALLYSAAMAGPVMMITVAYSFFGLRQRKEGMAP